MFEVKNRVEGFFEIKVLDENKNVIQQVDKFKNIILDEGLHLFGLIPKPYSQKDYSYLSQFVRYLALGKGTDEPLPSDTSLFKQETINQSPTANTSTATYDLENERYTEFSIKFYTTQKIPNGIFTEIGLTRETVEPFRLFNKSLIKDENGNPTSIEIKQGNFLEVIYTLRTYIPKEDIVFEDVEIEKDGEIKKITITARPMSFKTADWGFNLNYINENSCYFKRNVESLTEITNTSNPSGLFGGNRITSFVNVPYDYEKPFRRYLEFNLTLAENNYENINYFEVFGLFGRWQFLLSEGFTKTNNDELNLRFGISWGRRE